jgi:hypothetical protein
VFSDIFQHFIQKRLVSNMVLVFKYILFSSMVGLMLSVVCNIRPSVHSAYRHSEIQACVVALYGELKNPTING